MHLLPAAGPAAACGDGAQVDGGLLDTALEGPVCESTDTFGRHPLPPLHRGDLVAIGHAGAYCASFTSRYNGRPPPVEALLWPGGIAAAMPPPRARRRCPGANPRPARRSRIPIPPADRREPPVMHLSTGRNGHA